MAVFMKGMQTQYINAHGKGWVLFLDITVILRLKKEDFRGYASQVEEPIRVSQKEEELASRRDGAFDEQSEVEK